MANRFKVEAIFKGIDRVSAPMRRMQNRVGSSTRIMSRRLRSLNRGVGKFGGIAKRGALLAAGALTGLAVVMAKVTQVGMAFEQTLTNAAAKFPGNIRKGTKAFAELSAAAETVGSETEFSATQAAEGLNFLAMAGFDAKMAIGALPGVVDLATAAQVDLGVATDIATDSMGAFGLATKDPVQGVKNLARVNDVLAKTATTANTTIEAMFEAVKDGGPVATAAGASIETFGALAGTMANAGIKGSKAGTTLKTMFVALQAPTAKAAKELRRLGIVAKDQDGNMRDSITILGELKAALKSKGTADRGASLDAIFGKRAIAGVNVLLASGEENLRAYRKQLENSGGAAKAMADTMRGTTQGSLNSLKSAVEGVSISLFKQTQGPMKEAIDSATAWVRANKDVIATDLGDFLRQVGGAIAFLVKWRKPLAITVGVIAALVVGLKIFTGVMIAVNLAMAANPAVLITLAVIALIAVVVAAAVAIYQNWGPIKQFFAGIWKSIEGGLVVFGGFLVWLWESTRAFFVDTWQGIADFFIGLWEGTKAFFVGIWEGIPGFFSGLWEGIKAVFQAAIDGLILILVAPFVVIFELWRRAPQIFAAIWGGIKTLASDAWDAITEFFQWAWDSIVAVWEGIPGFFEGLWELLKVGVQAYIDAYIGIFQWAWDSIVAVWEGIPGFFEGLWEMLKAGVQAYIDAYIGIFQWAWDSIVAIWEGIPGFFSGLWDSVVGGVKSAFNSALAFVQSIIDKVMSKVATVQKAVGKVTGFLGLGGDEGGEPGPNVQTPASRTSKSINESRTSTTSTSEVVISDRTGRASAPRGLAPGVTLQPSGGF
jgi:TP901 family phage tail tape measure protein